MLLTGWGGGGFEVEGSLFYFLGENSRCGIGGMGTGEKGLCYVRRHYFGH